MFKAVVISNKDMLRLGNLTVDCPDVSNDYITVKYSSPYFVRNEGGFIAIPEEGSEILIHKPENSDDYFYISTVVGPAPNQGDRGIPKDFTVIKDTNIYTNRLKPQRVTFGDPKGNRVVFSNRYEKGRMIDSRASLQSMGGKFIGAIDSPNVDMCIMRNEHGDGIKVTADTSELFPARSIEVKALGSVNQVSLANSFNIAVIEGRDITVENLSNGVAGDSTFPGRAGNINLKTKHRDINIWTELEGKVFISTENSLFQINAGGDVVVHSAQNVKVRSAQDIVLVADGRVHLEGARVDIKSSGPVNVDGGGAVGVKAGADVALEGNAVHLNTPGAAGAGVDPAEQFTPEQNAYGK